MNPRQWGLTINWVRVKGLVMALVARPAFVAVAAIATAAPALVSGLALVAFLTRGLARQSRTGRHLDGGFHEWIPPHLKLKAV